MIYAMDRAPFDGASSQEREYASRAAARYAKRHGLTIVDHWPVNDPPPRSSDARVWDAYRARHGYAGG